MLLVPELRALGYERSILGPDTSRSITRLRDKLAEASLRAAPNSRLICAPASACRSRQRNRGIRARCATTA